MWKLHELVGQAASLPYTMIQEWGKRIAAGDTRALARAATAIENREPGAEALLAELQSHAVAKPLVLGVTGAPGAGKSTLADRLAAAFRKRSEERRVGKECRARGGVAE